MWFSHAGVSVQLPRELSGEVAVDDTNRSAIQTLSDAIINIGADQSDRFSRITAQQSADFAATMARIGLKESTRKRKVASWVLKQPAMAERGATQDFWATNDITKKSARVRIYSNAADTDRNAAIALKDAAKRELLVTNELRVPDVVRALDVVDTELGPAVILDQTPALQPRLRKPPDRPPWKLSVPVLSDPAPALALGVSLVRSRVVSRRSRSHGVVGLLNDGAIASPCPHERVEGAVMDVGLVSQVSEAAVAVGTYLGATAVGGVVQGTSFESVKALIGWFRDRGAEPTAAWEDPEVAAAVPAALGPVTGAGVEELVSLTRLARTEIAVQGGNRATTYGESSPALAVGQINGDVSFGQRP